MIFIKEGFPGGTSDEELACQCRRHKRDADLIFWFEDLLDEGMASHSSILDGRIPDRGAWSSPGSTGLQRVGHDWSDLVCTPSLCVCFFFFRFSLVILVYPIMLESDCLFLTPTFNSSPQWKGQSVDICLGTCIMFIK